MSDQPRENTDRELWREPDKDDGDSIHVTKEGGIGINVGGHVIVMRLQSWHQIAADYLGRLVDDPPTSGRDKSTLTEDGEMPKGARS